MAQPANVARALNVNEARLQRLAYLNATGRGGRISLRAALTLGRAQFKRAYPRFEEWQAARSGGQAQERPRRQQQQQEQRQQQLEQIPSRRRLLAADEEFGHEEVYRHR